MADVIKKSTNKFNKGLVLDFSPENTKNEVLTHALNATLLTFNGNEMSLQNDMGNARVETAFLPEGYIPVGTCEYGGIIYIVSYNPIEDKSQIGCFPSPERNISNDELGISDALISKNMFQEIENGQLTGDLLNNTQYVLLKNDNLNPGDKFLICADEQIYEEKLSDLVKDNEFVEHPVLALNVVSIEDSGKIIYLNSDIKHYDKQYNDSSYKYHILGAMSESTTQEAIEIDNYRNILSSGYSVFKSKTSGKLAILAELIMIDSYSVTHSIVPIEERKGCYNIIIHTDVEPKITAENYNIAPKLKYYYLENSQGYIQTYNETVNLFNENSINAAISNIKLSELYYSDSDTTLETNKFNFKPKNTYHTRTESYTGTLPNNSISTTFFANKYHRVTKNQLIGEDGNVLNEFSQARFYIENDLNAGYIKYNEPTLNDAYKYYIETKSFEYVNAARNKEYNTEQLYKLNSQIEYEIAKTDDITNIKKEKFIIVQTVHYKIITQKEYEELIQSGKEITFWKKSNNDTYESTSEFVKDSTYIKEEIENFKSIGFEINPSTYQDDIYISTTNVEYDKINDNDILSKYFNHNDSDFPYNEKDEDFYGFNDIFYYKETIINYEEADKDDLSSYEEDPSNWDLYYIPKYLSKSKNEIKTFANDTVLLVSMKFNTNITYNKFQPNLNSNYIAGYPESNPTYDDESPIELTHFADFLINNEYQYSDVILANIELPNFVYKNNLTLPFKYDYTLVPCMNYGKLNHLSISNSIKFENLFNFEASNFNTWKYYINNNQLRLIFGTEIYDTLSNTKVTGLVLEFYDMWGFAGSLEISNKKSYSGIFTKILNLNQISLSTFKTDNLIWYRNINIIKTDDIYKLNNRTVQKDEVKGWYYIDTKEFVQNDCGILYSNLIYGVKAYFKCETNSTIEYIEKDQFILFTLPIYNDYYYSCQNFNTLENPQLELMLTYKLTDKSTSNPLSNESYTNGYYIDDKKLVDDYINGYSKDNFSVEKYYLTEGTTDVNLEIGLKQEYQQYNLSYDKDINKYFKCKLELLNESFENITFDEGTIKNINDNFINYNFINNINQDSIKINYNFITKYKINISDIVETSIPVTTVCALFHQNESGLYNYSDFNLEECTYQKAIKDQAGKINYEYVTYPLSNLIFYNSGSHETSIFGTCKHIDGDVANLSLQCTVINKYETPAQKITQPGKLNAGNPLTEVVSQIGKLSFIQSHTHMMPGDETYGVNIHGDGGAHPYLVTAYSENKGTTENYDSWFRGTWSMQQISHWPRYNSVLNTKSMILNKNEFISTVDCKIKKDAAIYYDDANNGTNWYPGGKQRYYTGFSGQELAEFNKKMLETLKSVYVMNPDYSNLLQNVGTVSVDNPEFKLTAYLINKYSELAYEENKIFNDYIYLRSLSISDYVNHLKNYFEVNEANVNFQPNFKYCGTEEKPYLISSLNYQLPKNNSIAEDLAMTANDLIVVKHHDGTKTILHGELNSNLLYGYDDKSNKLVQLDVSNYKIDETGKLSITRKQFEGKNYTYLFNDNPIIGTNIPNQIFKNDILETPTLTYEFSTSNNDILLNDKNVVYILSPKNALRNSQLNINLKLNNETSPFDYNFEISEITLKCEGVLLDKDVFNNATLVRSKNFGNVGDKEGDKQSDCTQTLKELTISDCEELLKSSIDTGELSFKTDCFEEGVNDLFAKINNDISIQVGQPTPSTKIVINGSEVINNTSMTYNYPISFNMNTYSIADIEKTVGESTIAIKNAEVKIDEGYELYKFTIEKIKYSFSKVESYEKNPNSIILTNSTQKYSTIDNYRYTVLSQYKDAQFRGSSLTINDLEYSPSPDSHRLFVKNIATYNPYLRNKLYYRTYITDDKDYTLEDYKDLGVTYTLSQDLNTLFLYTGPCFTTENL